MKKYYYIIYFRGEEYVQEETDNYDVFWLDHQLPKDKDKIFTYNVNIVASTDMPGLAENYKTPETLGIYGKYLICAREITKEEAFLYSI